MSSFAVRFSLYRLVPSRFNTFGRGSHSNLDCSCDINVNIVTVVSFVEKKTCCNKKLSLNEDIGSEEPIG